MRRRWPREGCARFSTHDLFALMERSASEDAALDGPPENEEAESAEWG